jgi:hypothetical protein
MKLLLGLPTGPVRWWLWTLAAALLCGACERRDLTYLSDPTRCYLRLEVDWSAFGDEPHGLTVYCYPTDGGEPIRTITEEVHEVLIPLSEGAYDLLLFNLTPEEFSTIDFKGLDHFETAEAVAREKSADLESVRTRDVDRRAHQPEPLGVARRRNVQVTHTTDTLRLAPADVLYTGHVILYLEGLSYVSSVSSTLSQVSAGYYLGLDRCNDETVTHELMDWSRLEGQNRAGRDALTTDFPCFGLPATRAATDFYIDFALIDEQTVNSFYVDVSDRITYGADAHEFTITIDAATGDEEHPLIVIDAVAPPTVTPSTPSDSTDTGGFAVSVDDWGDTELIDIEI